MNENTILLWNAVRNGDEENVRRLLELKANPLEENDKGETAVDIANGSTWIIKCLLKGDDPCKRVSSLFKYIREHDEQETITLLKSWKQEFRQYLITSKLSNPPDEHWNSVFKAWLKTTEHYVELHGKKLDGETLLHVSTAIHSAPLVAILLEFGLDPNISRSDGWTPLHIACHDNNLEIVHELLSYHANPCIENIRGKSPNYYTTNDRIARLLNRSRIELLKENIWIPSDVISNFNNLVYWNNSIIELHTSGVYTCKIFTQELCNLIVNNIELYSPLWYQNYGAVMIDSNSIQFLELLLDRYKGPLSNYFKDYFKLEGELKLSSATILGIRNKDEQNVVCDKHTDDSILTINICIFKKNLKGSRLVFVPSNEEEYTIDDFNTGYAIIHSGLLPHYVEPIESGERINILLWLSIKN